MMKALLVVCVLAVAAHAQPKQNTGYLDNDEQHVLLEIDDCPATTLTGDTKLRVAAEHHMRGTTLYLQGDYPAAVKEFIDAYCLAPDLYTILKDIGQAYERDLDYEKAIEYFKRFVAQVPPDAHKEPGAGACTPDAQIDRESVLARIGVLSQLRAHVLVQTEPKDAEIVIANDAGVRNVGKSGVPLDVFRGRYTMTVTKPGFEPDTRVLETKIGLPTTVFVRLEPVKGQLMLVSQPSDARLYIDKNFVGTGRFENRHINAGTYEVSAEAPGYEDATQTVVVLPDQEARISVDMEAKPQSGRRQAIIAATIGGAVTFGSISNAFSQIGLTGVTGGTIAGAIVGFGGSYFFLPDDIALGTSSLAITSALGGYLLGSTVAALFSSDDNTITPLAGASAIVMAGTGYYVGNALHVKSGDAAVVNSGMVWGSAFGSLFSASFDADRRIGAALTLSGLGMGTIGGILSARYFNVSRSHAALIDLGGILGIIGGLAAKALIYPAGSSGSPEHLANFAIGGLAIGLVGSGILTRNFDAPPLPIAPTLGAAPTANGSVAPTLGFQGTF